MFSSSSQWRDIIFSDQTICPVDGGPCAGVECWYPGEFCILRQMIMEED